MPDKLTDSEIIKALRSWLEEIRKSRQAYLEKVNEEHYPSMRYEYLLSDTIHEINRQKAEIERLSEENEKQRLIVEAIDDNMFPLPFETDYDKAIKTAKAEAIKEFDERLKKKTYPFPCAVGVENAVTVRAINDLVKEMVGEE